MNACPACAKTVHPNDLVCPHCGISLHPGTATAGPASGGGKGLSVVAIVVIAIVGIVLILGCVGGAAFFFVGTPVISPTPPPVFTPSPPSSYGIPVEEGNESPVPEVPATQPPVEQPSPEKPVETP